MKEEDIFRQLNDMALTVGRSRVSEQTGFVHHHYHIDGTPQTIPTLENFVFAYALLKNKSAETIQEAKLLLERLLNFQCFDEGLSEGNFPIYLHEYPLCRDRLLSINLLPVVYWITKQFTTVLGGELNKKLQNATQGLISHSLQTLEEKPLPYIYQLKLASSLSAFGKLLDDKTLIERANSLESELDKDTLNSSWFSPADLGDILLSLQMEGASLSESGWENLWNHLCDTYDASLCAYVGPCLQQYYWKQQPQLTLYDYFMSSYTKTPLNRLNGEGSIVPLYASLIQPHKNILLEKKFPISKSGHIEGKKWLMHGNGHFSVSTLDHTGNKLDSLWKGILPMQLLVAEGTQMVSMVAQGGNYNELTSSIEGDCIQLEYELPEDVDVEHKEEKKEIVLSATRQDDMSLFVNGSKSNTFKLGDEVTLKFKEHTITTTFDLIQGDGRFIGHVMPGNRASQLALKNGNRFNAYDWQLFLRTLSRSGPCRIRVNVTVKRSL